MTTPHPLGPLPANNAEFLSTVHGPATSVGPRPRICFFRGDPSPPPGAPRPNWTGEPWSPTAKTDDPAANAYYPKYRS
jgi:hypothetical protein